MIAWIESLPTLLAGTLVVGGFVVSTLVLGYIVSKVTSQEIRAAHTDRAGFILAVIGVVYAVLLAFVAIGVLGALSAGRGEDVRRGRIVGKRLSRFGVVPALGTSARNRARVLALGDRRRVAENEPGQQSRRSPIRSSRPPTATYALCRSPHRACRILRRRCSSQWIRHSRIGRRD